MKTKFTCLVVLFLIFSNIGFPNNETSPEKVKFYINSNNSENDLKAAFFADCPTNIADNSISTSDETTICGEGSISITGLTPSVLIEADTIIQWQSKTPSGSWVDAGGSGLNYTTSTLTETTSFRRVIIIAGCGEDPSNEITVTVNPIPVAPTGETTQSFCASDAPTVASLTISGSNILWYSDITATTTVQTTDALTDGTTYYATQTVNSCESTTLAVTAELVLIPAEPTGEANQSFCSSDIPTVNDFVVTGSNISWYSNVLGTNPVQTSANLVDGTTYYATQTVNGCESATLAVTAEVISSPILSASGIDPTSCGEQGTINFTFTNVGDGSHTIYYDGGSFSVNVSGGSASYSANAGTYNNLYIIVNECQSTNDVDVTISAPDVPSAPTGETTQSFCFSDAPTVASLTVSGSNILWYSDVTATTPIQTTDELADGTMYYATQTVNGCESNTLGVTAVVTTTPVIVNVDENDPLLCQTTGSLTFNFNDVPAGIYDITYDGGSFSNVLVALNSAVVLTNSGTYNNLTITVNGCSSASGINASLSDPNPPPAPTGEASQSFCSSDQPTVGDFVVSGSGEIHWYSDAATNNSIQTSEVLTNGTTYYATQTVNGCESATIAVTAEIISSPVISNVTEIDPIICQGQGSLNFTFSGVSDGTYEIVYDGNSFTNVSVSGNFASVPANAGAYNNLRITANGCTSNRMSASLSDPNPPPTPTILVQDNCGESVLTATGYSGTLLWSTDETTESIIVNTGGDYSLTQTLNGCTSNAATETASPKTIPSIVSVTENNPTSCTGSGTLDFTFTNIPNGSYTIAYDGGSFSSVAVSGNEATVTAPAGNYNNLAITVNGCTSESSISASLSEPTPPAAPTITVENNCGESVLTASNYTGTLAWSTGESSESIIVNVAGQYSLTQTIEGCTSNAATETATPKIIPAISSVKENDPADCQGKGSLEFTFTNVPDGTYTIAYDGSSFAGVIISNNKANIEASAGTYNNLRITVDNCTSANGINASLSDPNPPPTPTISVQNNCGESVLTASNYTGTLFWSTEESSEIITVNTAGNYSLTQIVNGCTSEAATASATPKIIPGITNIIEIAPTICQGLGSLDFTFAGVPNGSYSILYDGGNFNNVAVSGSVATVIAPAGTYNNLTITVNGCTSVSGINASLPEPTTPPAPTITVQNGCGESVITASNYTGLLTWSTGENTPSIVVNTAGEYSVTQTVNGCISNAAVKTAVPNAIPSITSVKENDPNVCQGLGSLDFQFDGVPNGTYTINYDGSSFSNVVVTGGTATVSASARRYNNLRITVEGCTSENGINARLSDPNPPPTPIISVEDYCGESILTASNYTGSLTWDTGETTESIKVYSAREYTLTQTVNGCTSDAASAPANPKRSSLIPEVDVINNCGESEIVVNNLTDNAWLFWQVNNEKDSVQDNNFTTTEAGEYTIFQKLGNCASLEAIVNISPHVMPSPPTGNDKEICATETIQELMAEATVSENNSNVLWFDEATGGNEILSPVLDTVGTVTYYAESKNNTTGCISNERTPVTLTIKPNPKTFFTDTTIIGKPKSKVAVLIFPNDSQKYQWYLNNNEITAANAQYYYIIESERVMGNVFTIEVELQNGCKAKFNYPYSGNATDNEFNAFKSYEIDDQNNSIKIYPNPANSNLNIAFNPNSLSKNQKLNAKIYSDIGSCVLETPLDQNPQSIDIKKLRPGFYSVAIFSAGNRLLTKKIVVTKH